MIRFKILLPLFYNDGRPIEREQFLQTDDDLVQLFGATSTDTVAVRGRWLYQSRVYQDQLLRVRLDAQDTPDNWQSVRAFKETLKARFEQLNPGPFGKGNGPGTGRRWPGGGLTHALAPRWRFGASSGLAPG